MPDEEKAEETQEEQPTIEQADSPDEAELPDAEISVIISSLATQALIGLGVMGHPMTKEKHVDLTSAKFSIDLLQVLEEKTKGNLSDLEQRFLETLLHDLRMKFVEATK